MKCATRFGHFRNEVLFDIFKSSVQFRYKKSMPMLLKNSQKTNSDLCAGYNLHIYSPIQKFCYLSLISKFQNFYSKPKQVRYILQIKTGPRKKSYRKTSIRFITCFGHKVFGKKLPVSLFIIYKKMLISEIRQGTNK